MAYSRSGCAKGRCVASEGASLRQSETRGLFDYCRSKKSLHILPADKQVKDAIYTLVWNEKEVVNYVNDVEVARSKNPLAGEALHLLLRSYLPENVKGTGKMEID